MVALNEAEARLNLVKEQELSTLQSATFHRDEAKQRQEEQPHKLLRIIIMQRGIIIYWRGEMNNIRLQSNGTTKKLRECTHSSDQSMISSWLGHNEMRR